MHTTKSSHHKVLTLIWLLLLGGSHSFASAQTASLESVKLSKNSVPTWCPVAPENSNAICRKQDARIEVASSVKNPNNESISFIYVVTGGEIIGSGPRVIWDLHKAQPGKHSITVGLGEGMVVRGRTITKPVAIEACPVCDLPCACPILMVRGPDTPVAAGDAFIVEAELRGGAQEPYPKYQWTVSEGTVIEGQGASRALIRTDEKSKVRTVEVRLEINAVGLCPSCPTTEMFKISMAPAKP